MVIPDNNRPSSNKKVALFWVIMAVGNMLWSGIPHLLMLLKTDDRPISHNHLSVNTTHYPAFSRLVHEPFPEEQRLLLKESAKKMFYWGYDNYMNYAYPADELDPIHCTGRGHDWANPSNININDVLGDYSLTLVDSLDTLAILGDTEEFKKAVKLVIAHVTFDKCTTVQVFEATIRVLGSLLTAHLLIIDPDQRLGPLAPQGYDNELLHMAHDLANRLLPAFDNTTTGLPHPRVNLCHGVPLEGVLEGCTSGIGTLTVEFGLLSRLLGDPTYENIARNVVRVLWDYRHPRTGLLGNVIHLNKGEWVGPMAGVGAGLDSFYEYLLKSYMLYGEQEDLEMFDEFYYSINKYIRKGRSCAELLQTGSVFDPPIYGNVDYRDGRLLNYWIDSLSASLPALQVLAGDINEAICNHAVHYTIWRKYGALPERFDFRSKSPVVAFYPLRPELVESTYFLYQATRNPFYLHVGQDLLNDLEQYTKERCGYATLHNVIKKDKEDRMESFFLSETCKYLYLLFDTDHALNRHASEYMFTTEGHVLRIDPSLRNKAWKGGRRGCDRESNTALLRINESTKHFCPAYDSVRKHSLPLSRQLLGEIEYLIGLYDDIG